jgi:hypothetical protein
MFVKLGGKGRRWDMGEGNDKKRAPFGTLFLGY